jgi:hypothetical protein
MLGFHHEAVSRVELPLPAFIGKPTKVPLFPYRAVQEIRHRGGGILTDEKFLWFYVRGRIERFERPL